MMQARVGLRHECNTLRIPRMPFELAPPNNGHVAERMEDRLGRKGEMARSVSFGIRTLCNNPETGRHRDRVCSIRSVRWQGVAFSHPFSSN